MWKRLVAWLKQLNPRSDIYFAKDLYMKRWRFDWLGRNLPGVRVHYTVRSDNDRELHDHPFSFLSIMLWGSYTEELLDGTKRTFKAPALIFRQAEVFHRLELTKPVLTLVFRGPFRREWGFLRGGEWISERNWFQPVTTPLANWRFDPPKPGAKIPAFNTKEEYDMLEAAIVERDGFSKLKGDKP